MMLNLRQIPFLILVFLFLGIGKGFSQANTLRSCTNAIEYQNPRFHYSTTIAAHPLENILAVGLENGLAIYEMPEFTFLFEMPIPDFEAETFVYIDTIEWSPDGAMLAASLIYSRLTDAGESIAQPRLIVWNVENREIIASFQEEGETAENAILHWSPDSTLLTGIIHRSQYMRIWNISRNQEVFEFEINSEVDFAAGIAWSANSQELVLVHDANFGNQNSNTVQLIFIQSQEAWEIIETAEIAFGELRGISQISNGRLALLSGAIYLFDVENHIIEREIFDAQNRHELLSWSSEGQYLVTAGQYHALDGLKFYDSENEYQSRFLETGIRARELELNYRGDYIYLVSKENDFLAGNLFNGIYVLDMINSCIMTAAIE